MGQPLEGLFSVYALLVCHYSSVVNTLLLMFPSKDESEESSFCKNFPIVYVSKHKALVHVQVLRCWKQRVTVKNRGVHRAAGSLVSEGPVLE